MKISQLFSATNGEDWAASLEVDLLAWALRAAASARSRSRSRFQTMSGSIAVYSAEQRFSKVSALVHLLDQGNIESTFENFCECVPAAPA